MAFDIHAQLATLLGVPLPNNPTVLLLVPASSISPLRRGFSCHKDSGPSSAAPGCWIRGEPQSDRGLVVHGADQIDDSLAMGIQLPRDTRQHRIHPEDDTCGATLLSSILNRLTDERIPTTSVVYGRPNPQADKYYSRVPGL